MHEVKCEMVFERLAGAAHRVRPARGWRSLRLWPPRFRPVCSRPVRLQPLRLQPLRLRLPRSRPVRFRPLRLRLPRSRPVRQSLERVRPARLRLERVRPARLFLAFRPLRRFRLLASAALPVLGVAAGGAHAVELKLATVAPDGTVWMREMRAGAQRIDELTDGRVQFKFYPGGVMGNDAQVLRRMRVGQLHGGAFAVSGLTDHFSPLSVYSVPLLIRSLDEVDHVRARIDPLLQAGLEEAGFVSFGFIEGGFAHLMANTPVRGVEDMRRRKVWIPEGDNTSFIALQALGLSPVALPITDVLTGLQTGLLDIVAASPTVTLVLQWHTRVRYVTDLPVVYSMGIFALDSRVFGRLAAADRQVVREVMTGVVQRLDRQARQDNAQAREAMENMGIEFIPVDPADVSVWRDAIAATIPQLRERNEADARYLDQLLATLAEYRQSRARAPRP